MSGSCVLWQPLTDQTSVVATGLHCCDSPPLSLIHNYQYIPSAGLSRISPGCFAGRTWYNGARLAITADCRAGSTPTWCSQISSQQTRGVHPLLFQCCASVEDGGPTLKQHWVKRPFCWDVSVLSTFFDVVSLGKALHPHLLHFIQV